MSTVTINYYKKCVIPRTTRNVFILFMSISQEPSTHLSHLFQTQETERTSGMISDTSVPQGHQETDPDAGSSSTITSGGATWTRRESGDEDMEVMSNDSDTTIEIPEVNYQAVGAHGKKLLIQGFVTRVEIDLIDAR
jgi:hypothetical protein